MREEVSAAVLFLTRLVRLNDNIEKEKADEFSDKLLEILMERFKNHWYEDKPTKGQAYRCIQMNPSDCLDPVLAQAALDCGLNGDDLKLPLDITVWVDPEEVCCRFGHPRSTYCTVASFKGGCKDNKALTLDITDYVEQQRQELTRQNFITKRINNHHESHDDEMYGNHGNSPTGFFVPYMDDYNYNSNYFLPYSNDGFNGSSFDMNGAQFYSPSSKFHHNQRNNQQAFHHNDAKNPGLKSSHLSSKHRAVHVKQGSRGSSSSVPFKSHPSSSDRYHWVKPTEPAKA